MALNKLTADALVDGTLDADAIGPASITTAKLNSNIISGQTAIGTVDVSNDLLLIYDADATSLKKVPVSSVGATNTDSIIEGSSNLYYTNARADARAQLKIDALVDSAPGTLDTLNELAAALGDDASFSTTVTNSIATKLPLAGGTITGDVTFTGDNYNIVFDKSDNALEFASSAKATFGGNLFQIWNNGSHALIDNYQGDIFIRNGTNDRDILIQSDDGSGGLSTYFQADGSTGSANLRNYGSIKLATTATGVDVTGTVTVNTGGSDATNTSHLGGDFSTWIRVGDAISNQTQTNGFGIKFHDQGVIHWSVGGLGTDFKISRTNTNGDQLFPAGSLDALTINSSGKVGIGTTTPADPLHVQFSNNDGGDTGIIVKNTNTGTTTNFAGVSTQAVNGSVLGTFSSADYDAWGVGTFAGSQSNHPTYLIANNAVKMVIDTSGNVGIGLVNPSSYDSGARKLVVGDPGLSSQGITISADTNSIIYFADGTSGAEAYMGSVIYNHANNNMTFRTNGFNSAMVIDSSQNVGIAKSTLATWSSGYNALQVGGRGFVGAHSSSDLYVGQNASFNSGWKYEASTAASLTQHSGGKITHLVAPVGTAGNAISWNTAMDITPTGNVGFGTGNPTTKFIVAGATSGDYLAKIESTNQFGLKIKTTSTSDSHEQLAIHDGNNNIQFKVMGGGTVHATGINIGGSGAANRLDDYEEGTWTPGIDGLTNTPNFYNLTGRYTKIGRQVTIQYFAQTANSPAPTFSSITAEFKVTGLPFAVLSNGYTGSQGSVNAQSFSYHGTYNTQGVVGSGTNGGCYLTCNVVSSQHLQFQVTNSGGIRGIVNNRGANLGFIIEATCTYFTT